MSACSFGSDALRAQLLRHMCGLALLGAYAVAEDEGAEGEAASPGPIHTMAVSNGKKGSPAYDVWTPTPMPCNAFGAASV